MGCLRITLRFNRRQGKSTVPVLVQPGQFKQRTIDIGVESGVDLEKGSSEPQLCGTKR